MKHTSGPWKQGTPYNIPIAPKTTIYRENGTIIAEVIRYPLSQSKEAEANAKLIAKSPQMAELLQRLVIDGWSASISMEAQEIIQTLD